MRIINFVQRDKTSNKLVVTFIGQIIQAVQGAAAANGFGLQWLNFQLVLVQVWQISGAILC